MTKTKRLMGLILCGVLGWACLPVLAELNLCDDCSFANPQDPLDGWNYNYEWSGISKLMDNHKKISFLPSFKGKKNVLHMTSGGRDTKVETAVMEYEPGARYKCTFDFYGVMTGAEPVKVFFLGYALRPGIAPAEVAQLRELRRVYKGMTVSAGDPSWKTITVTLPDEKVSELAAGHLKKVRYMTVMMLMLADSCFGDAYITNVKVVKMAEKYKVTKEALKPSSSSAGEGE